MKKRLAMFVGVLTCMAALADTGLKQLSVTMSTEGPDYYADGTTPVLVGETYLLVYVKEGTGGFKGVYMDGSLVDTENNVLVTKSYAVTGAKCGFQAIQYPAGMFAAGGDFVIVLLDTRTDAGAVGGLVAGQDAFVAGQAASPEATASAVTLSAAAQSGGVPTLITAGKPAVSYLTPAPVVSKVDPNGDAVEVRIKNVVPGVNYEVQSRADLSAGEWRPVANAARVNTMQNAVPGGEELSATAAKPENDTVRFFRVIIPGEVK